MELNGQQVTEAEIDSVTEPWTVVTLKGGIKVNARVIVNKVYVLDEPDEFGEPQVIIQSALVINAKNPVRKPRTKGALNGAK